MPPKKSSLGKKTKGSLVQQSLRSQETSQEREFRLTNERNRASTSRAAETLEHYNARLGTQRVFASTSRINETPNKENERLSKQRIRSSRLRAHEAPEQRQERLQNQQTRSSRLRAQEAPEQRQIRLQSQQIRSSRLRAHEAPEQRQVRLQNQQITSSTLRAQETPEQHQIRLSNQYDRTLWLRSIETTAQHDLRLSSQRSRSSSVRANEVQSEREGRLRNGRLRVANVRSNETPEERDRRLRNERSRVARMRDNETLEERNAHRIYNQRRIQNRLNVYERIAFNYDPNMDYTDDDLVSIGQMDNVCNYCNALKYKNEPPGICCGNGKIVLPELRPPPQPLLSLVSGTTSESKHFLSNIRKYNSCFQMTSFGATNVVREHFMPTFRVQGQIYHRMGSLLPTRDHKYVQIYFMGQADDLDQVQQRRQYNPETRERIVAELQLMLHENNELVRTFKKANDDLQLLPNHQVVIHADKIPAGEHQGRYNAPTANDVAILMVGDPVAHRDIIVRRYDDRVNRISETHRSYDALQYPVIFPYGDDGYHFEIRQINPVTNVPTSKKVSSMNFYAYRIMIRQNATNHILNCRELFHQYIVDMYAKIETERLMYIRHHQSKLRADDYIHLRDALNNHNDINPNDLGQAVILPASFTGSPRHMQEYTQDAMVYVRSYGRPDLFITFTCNPKWEEITSALSSGQTSVHRHDIIARVFRQKLMSLMDFMVKLRVFGETRCWMYTVEWQKRGLPHAHILIWLVEKITPDVIDDIISAEIPDINVDPILHQVVVKNMVHGPCGLINQNSPCMADGKCTKKYPRQFVYDTITGIDGYPLYRRRSTTDGGHSFAIKVRNNDVDIDNRWIVPYCPLLSKTFNAHINVECCNSVKSIKYICKYVNKGSDMAVFSLQNPNDEISHYQMARYISSNEAVWRILGFPIHQRNPTVVHLSVHLENGQRVYFTESNARERSVTPPATTLTSFFDLCANDPFAKTLLYAQIPSYYTWIPSSKKFKRRQKGKPVEGWPNVYSTNALGRIYNVHPHNSECFYLRLLLVNICGPTSFEYLRTVDGEVLSSYREACRKLNLLENDSHWETTLADSTIGSNPRQIRILFAIILVSCSPSNPRDLWNKFKNSMTEDILSRERIIRDDASLQYSEETYNEALILLEDKCLQIQSKTLLQVGMISPIRSDQNIGDIDFRREITYDAQQLLTFLAAKISLLTPEQKAVYNNVLETIESQSGGLYFLDAPGGTGKTFVISLILAKVRSKGNIALAVASSGIAATLLDGGRTAHSAFKLPLKAQYLEDFTCNIKKNSSMGKVLQSCKIIIWDECTMAHKKSLEALDRTMQDLRNNSALFGGALVLLAGDFRQTLPVIPRSTPADELNACLKSSFLWSYVRTLKLTINMRAQIQCNESSKHFSKQLMDLGNGKIPVDAATKCIKFPSDFCKLTNSIEELVDGVFPNIENNINNIQWLSERALLAPKNIDVDSVNSSILDSISGNARTYKSIDTVTTEDDAVNYPVEFLNSLDLPGFPPHYLVLKVGVPIILLRNIDPPRLCNGTRLTVKKLHNNLIEATIITGKYVGSDILLPRIPLIATEMPFNFKRLQFPVRLAFAMTINKSQGQTLRVCGLNLACSCFSHGQLYVACSRVGRPTDLFVYAPEGKTKNIVYPKALQ